SAGDKDIVLDMHEVSYIDSTGLGALVTSLTCARNRGGTLRLTNVPQRIQGSWVDEEEVRQVVAHWRNQSPEVAYVSGIEGEADGAGGSQPGLFGGSTGNDGDDGLLRQAIEIVVRSGLGSTSLLQRKLKVGFARAGRLMDELEERGVVGPSEGSKPRAVLMSVEELDATG
ncbi:MAG: hypothetical protein RL430_1333, partial [Actinomycetota bacterium]